MSPPWPIGNVRLILYFTHAVRLERSLAMRRICWGTALLSVFVIALPATAAGPGCACSQGGKTGSCQGLSAPACAAPCYSMSPGCCRSAPSCCDNAWDGYCQEVARWRALWGRIGTGAAIGYGQDVYMPYPTVEATEQLVPVPEPATPAQPVIPPVPDPLPPDPEASATSLRIR